MYTNLIAKLDRVISANSLNINWSPIIRQVSWITFVIRTRTSPGLATDSRSLNFIFSRHCSESSETRNPRGLAHRPVITKIINDVEITVPHKGILVLCPICVILYREGGGCHNEKRSTQRWAAECNYEQWYPLLYDTSYTRSRPWYTGTSQR